MSLMDTNPNGSALPRTFRKLLSGYLLSAFGDGVYLIAINWWVVSSTGSATALGVVAASGAAAFMICAPLSGRAIDRFGVMRLLIGADVWRISILGVFFILGLMGWDQAGVAFFLPLMVLMAVGTSISQPGIFTLIPSILPQSQVRRANSVLITGRSIATLAGPAVAGVILGLAGVEWAILLNMATFGASLVVLLAIYSAVPGTTQAATLPVSPKASTTRVIFTNRTTASAFVVALVGNLALSMYTVTLPLKYAPSAQDRDGSSVAYGFTYAAFQAGMITLGILLAQQKANRIKTTSMNVGVGLLAMGVALTAVGYLEFLPAVLIAALVMGSSLMFVSLLSDTQLQLTVPERSRGAVQGIVQGLGSALRPVGILLATTLFGIGGSGTSLLVAGLIVAAIAITVIVNDGYRGAVQPESGPNGETTRA